MHARLTLFASLVLAVILIGASPASAQLTFLAQWGTHGSNPGQFDSPEGIAVGASGTVFVLDENNARVQKFTSEGQYLGQFGSWGNGLGQFEFLSSIALDGAEYPYVSDTSYRIQRFGPGGAVVSFWGGYGTNAGRFLAAPALAIDAANVIYAADYYFPRVQMFSQNGVYLGEWGRSGELTAPAAIGVEENGDVIVLDWLGTSARFVRFTSTGQYVSEWTSPLLTQPAGFAISGGSWYVANINPARVYQFTSTGGFVSEFGSFGSGNGQFINPFAIAADGAGNVYVCDEGNDRILKFGPAPVPANHTSWGRVKGAYRN